MGILSLLSFIDSYCFTRVLLQKSFIFRKMHKKNSDEYSAIQVSDNLKIKNNSVKISRTNGNTGLKKNKN